MSTYKSVDEIRQEAESKLQLKFDVLWDDAKKIWQVAALRRAIRAIEVKSRSIESLQIKAGYLGALEIIKLVATSIDAQGLQDLFLDIDLAKKLMRGEVEPKTEYQKPKPKNGTPLNGNSYHRYTGPRPWLPEENQALDMLAKGESKSAVRRALGWVGSPKLDNIIYKARKIKDSW